jgi:predicted secreted acid phosphatase
MIPILIVLDIDETILQFIPKQNYNLWKELFFKTDIYYKCHLYFEGHNLPF